LHKSQANAGADSACKLMFCISIQKCNKIKNTYCTKKKNIYPKVDVWRIILFLYEHVVNIMGTVGGWWKEKLFRADQKLFSTFTICSTNRLHNIDPTMKSNQ
jgi:hypothetical protein